MVVRGSGLQDWNEELQTDGERFRWILLEGELTGKEEGEKKFLYFVALRLFVLAHDAA